MFAFERPDQIPAIDVHAVGEFATTAQHTADSFAHGGGINHRDLADARVEYPLAVTAIVLGDVLGRRKITVDKLGDTFRDLAFVATRSSAYLR